MSPRHPCVRLLPPCCPGQCQDIPNGPLHDPPVPARVRPSCSPCLPALPSPASRQLTKVKGLRGRQLSKEKWRLRSYANTDEAGRADCRGTGTDAKSEHIHSNKLLALVIKFKRVAYANILRCPQAVRLCGWSFSQLYKCTNTVQPLKTGCS